MIIAGIKMTGWIGGEGEEVRGSRDTEREAWAGDTNGSSCHRKKPARRAAWARLLQAVDQARRNLIEEEGRSGKTGLEGEPAAERAGAALTGGQSTPGTECTGSGECIGGARIRGGLRARGVFKGWIKTRVGRKRF